MFLLDTNVVSELRKGLRADARVRAWSTDRGDELHFLSAITVLELKQRVLLKARSDPGQGDRLHRWLHDQVLPHFEGRILPVDADVALRAAALHVPDRMPERDGLIAATALVHGLVVVTRNVVDFERSGVRLVDPWAA